jgi:hypothetical protein
VCDKLNLIDVNNAHKYCSRAVVLGLMDRDDGRPRRYSVTLAGRALLAGHTVAKQRKVDRPRVIVNSVWQLGAM